jgi:hypothetical protein
MWCLFLLGGIVADPTKLQRWANQDRLAKIYTRKYRQKGGGGGKYGYNAKKQEAWLSRTLKKFT